MLSLLSNLLGQFSFLIKDTSEHVQPAHLAAPLVVESVLFVRVCDGCLTSLVVLVGVEVAL